MSDLCLQQCFKTLTNASPPKFPAMQLAEYKTGVLFSKWIIPYFPEQFSRTKEQVHIYAILIALFT